jgi:hypothetical protein
MERQEASGAGTVHARAARRSLLKETCFGAAAAAGLCLCDTTS